MKRKSIDCLEAELGKGIPRDTISVGFDVSMYSTGVALLVTTNNYIKIEELEVIKVPKVPKKASTKEQLKAINVFRSQLDGLKTKYIQKYNIDVARIEDSFLGKNVKTLKALTRNGILAYDRFEGIVDDIDFITPISTRSKASFKKSSKKIKSYKLKKELVEYVNRLFEIELKTKENDKADAILLALAGLVEVCL